MGLGLSDAPLPVAVQSPGVIIAMAQILLLFMILRLNSATKLVPLTYLRAAVSLGSSIRGRFRVHAPANLARVGAVVAGFHPQHCAVYEPNQ